MLQNTAREEKRNDTRNYKRTNLECSSLTDWKKKKQRKRKEEKSYAKVQLVELSLLTAVCFCCVVLFFVGVFFCSGLYQEHLGRQSVIKRKAREGREKSDRELLETL